MMNILESASADDIKSSGVSMKELFGRISIDPEKLVNSLIGLAEERDKLKIAIDEEAEAALAEDREVDAKKISDNFNKAVENFIEELENVKGFQDFEEDENLEGDDAEDKEIEEQFKNTMEELREKEAGTISPTTSHPLPNYKLFDLSNNTSLIGAERKAAEYVNEIWNTIMLPLRAAEKLGKDVGQMVKEDIETITKDTKEKDLPEKLDSIKKQIKNTGKLPDEVAAIVVPMFSIFGGTEAEAAESTDEPVVLDEITITAPKPIKSGTKKKIKNVGGMAGETGSSPELAQIKKDEDFRSSVYKDSKGIDTVGYGFNLERKGAQEALNKVGIKKSVVDLRNGKAQLTEDESSQLVISEMDGFENTAKRFVGKNVWKTLSKNRQGILTNMAYNMGEGKLGEFTKLKAAIRSGNWKEAQKQMKNSLWAKQTKGRAERLIARMGQDDRG